MKHFTAPFKILQLVSILFPLKCVTYETICNYNKISVDFFVYKKKWLKWKFC